jgi:mRNA-degrading endonuclease toxin of MazEF toxin-antitoxin module
VFLYDGAIVPDPQEIITSGHENKTARTVAVRQNETINAGALTVMFRAIIANNRAGGWRRLKRED